MFVKVVDYNPQWENAFATEAKHIRQILGNELINVFHIGSTSIKGMKAKPIIDIMPIVNDMARLDGYSLQFEQLGYEVMGEFGIPGRRYYRKGGDDRTHQIQRSILLLGQEIPKPARHAPALLTRIFTFFD